MSIKLYKGDCLIESDKIEDGSVDLILTDLPYGMIKNAKFNSKDQSEWDKIIDTKKIMNIANRILRKNGKMVLFAQGNFAIELAKNAIPNLPFNYKMIWEKDNFANCLLSKKAPVSYFEDILVFSKEYDLEKLHPLREYFKKVLDFIGLKSKQINKILGHRKVEHSFYIETTQFDLCTKEVYNELIKNFNINKMEGFKKYEELVEQNNNFNYMFRSVFNLWEGKKYKSNILKYKKDNDGFHPTQKPVLLLEDLIKTYSNKNDLVIDFTMGSGSTAVACKKLERDFIGIEKDDKYFKIAEDRINRAEVQYDLF